MNYESWWTLTAFVAAAYIMSLSSWMEVLFVKSVIAVSPSKWLQSTRFIFVLTACFLLGLMLTVAFAWLRDAMLLGCWLYMWQFGCIPALCTCFYYNNNNICRGCSSRSRSIMVVMVVVVRVSCSNSGGGDRSSSSSSIEQFIFKCYILSYHDTFLFITFIYAAYFL